MSYPLQQRLFSIAILIWSAVILYFCFSGRMITYLAPNFRPIALWGGIGLLILGGLNLFMSSRHTGCGHNHADDVHDSHESVLNPWLVVSVMILPVILAVAWTKDEFSLDALARKGLYDPPPRTTPTNAVASQVTREDIEKNRSKTADGYFPFTLTELYFAVNEQPLIAAVAGMKIQTEGQWALAQASPNIGTQGRIYHLLITCCAADAQVIPVTLEFGKPPPDFPPNAWIKVTGVITYPTQDGFVQPVVIVDTITATAAPYDRTPHKRRAIFGH